MLRNIFMMLWLLVGLAGCGADSVVETSAAVRPARLITVGAGDHSAPSQFVGKVAPAHTVELGFEIDGTLQQLPLPEGALVQAGDVIAQLDPERFELALESARAVTSTQYFQSRAAPGSTAPALRSLPVRHRVLRRLGTR